MCSEREKMAIRVTQVTKRYHLYPTTAARLKEWLWRPLARHLNISLSPYYDTFTALEEVSFELPRGHTMGVIGRNGSGKSTLLQLICGTLQPTSGTIEVNGRVAALLELGAGFNPEFTGRENIYIYGAVMGLSRQQIDQRYADMVEFADIGEFVNQPVKSYSSGMLVRLAFSVIAHVDADILIIDEALAVGDAFFVQKCMRFLRRFMEEGTVLFVSHDSAAVTNLCDRAIWLERGQMRMTGSAKEITEHYLAASYAEVVSSPSSKRVSIQSNSDEGVTTPPRFMPTSCEYYDQRRDLVNASALRNDLEVFSFDSSRESFGEGGADILMAALYDKEGRRLSWVIGGEAVALHVECLAHRALVGPIVGFLLKDRLGQVLFGDNTYLTVNDMRIQAGKAFRAEFAFMMPILPRGHYSIALALAEGTQKDHVQHQWIHDALLIESHASSESTGLIGIPMHYINLTPSS